MPKDISRNSSVDVVVRQTSADPEVEEAAAANTSAKARQTRSEERSAIRRRMWDLFKEHHYMTSALSMQSSCSIARWGGVPVGFIATMCKPGKPKKDDKRQRA